MSFSCVFLIVHRNDIGLWYRPEVFEDEPEGIIEKLVMKGIEVLIICGRVDEDCLPQCLEFESKAGELGLKLKVNYIDGLGHNYPDDFRERVSGFLK